MIKSIGELEIYMAKIIDMKAMEKWNKIPKELQKRLINNVYCSKCFETSIVDYDIKDDKYGIVLEGKCKKCGSNVARMVEGI